MINLNTFSTNAMSRDQNKSNGHRNRSRSRSRNRAAQDQSERERQRRDRENYEYLCKSSKGKPQRQSRDSRRQKLIQATLQNKRGYLYNNTQPSHELHKKNKSSSRKARHRDSKGFKKNVQCFFSNII